MKIDVPKKIGVVGNRFGWTLKYVSEKLKELGVTKYDTIISGGCYGVDDYACKFAIQTGAKMIIYPPDPDEPSPDRYFNRNKQIAEECDWLIAFDRGSSGGSGTLNTINHAKRVGKKVTVIDE